MADTTIGALSVRITANTSGLKKGMKDTDTLLQKGRKSLNDNAASFAKWGSAGVAASAAIAAAIFKSQAATIDALAKTSDKLGITTEALTGLRLAAEQTGVSSNTMDMALQRMTRRLAEAGQGGGEAKKAIEELGLSAQELAASTPDEALKTIADAMKGVESQSDRVRLAFKFFDSEGVALVNTLALGSAGLNQFEQDAKDLGIAISRVDAAKVEQANDQLNLVSKVIEGALQQATIELAPIITALAGSFADAAKEAGGMGDFISDALDGVIDSVGFVMDAFDGIDRTFEAVGKGIALVALGVVANVLKMAEFISNRPVQAINELIEAMNQLPFVDVMPVSLTDFGETVKNELELTKLAISEGMSDIGEIFDRPLPSEALKATVAEARAAAEELAKITAASAVGGEGGADDGGEAARFKLMQEATARNIVELEKRQAAEQAVRAEGFAFDEEAFATSLLTKQELEDFNNEVAEQKQQEHKDRIAEIDRVASAVQMQQTATALGAVATLVSLGGKKSEKAVRALSIAIAIIQGHGAAVAAWKAGMDIGGPAAPATAALYAAASIAQTGMMIAKLKSGSKGSSKPSGATASASSAGGNGNNGSQQTGTTKRFDLTLVGSTFSAEQVRELMGQFSEQIGDGVEFNTN